MTSDGASRGAAWLAQLLAGGRLVVRDSKSEIGAAGAQAESKDGVVTVTATFGAQEAVGEWAVRQVVAPDGTVIDEEAIDLGRKAPDTVWTLQATIDFNPAD